MALDIIPLRTRTHLRKIDTSPRDSPDCDSPATIAKPSEGEQNDALLIPGQLADGTRVIHPTETGELSRHVSDNESPEDIPTTTDIPTNPAPPLEAAPETLRRSTRVRRAPLILSPNMEGKHHSEVPRC